MTALRVVLGLNLSQAAVPKHGHSSLVSPGMQCERVVLQVWGHLERAGLEANPSCINAYVQALVHQVTLEP